MGLDQYKQQHTPYPKSVFFIVSNEFCERFSFYGMKTILSLYLINILLYTENDAKIIYHTFTMFVYFFPIFGAIISDSFLGKFRTILYISIIYAIGNIVLSLAATDPIQLPQKPFSIIGLLLIAIGTGGIKPCVSAFGGDQFILPQQELQLAAFFSMFYFSINAGSLISTFLTPVLREDVHCFGNDSCYPLAFAVPGILMIISIVIFALGKPLYKIRKPEGNVLIKVASCIGHAIKKKMNSKKKVDHWLDYSEEAFGKKLVDDIKITLKVLTLYIPLPIFWALYDQQGTGWTFQAVKMNGNIGFYTILPDQMQVINPLLILIFIPLFTYCIYPMLGKCYLLRSPLQRMVCGGFLTAASFAISASISLALEATYPILPTQGNAHLRIYNTLDCNTTINSNLAGDIVLPSLSYKEYTNLEIHDNTIVNLKVIQHCNEYKGDENFSFKIKEKTAYGVYLTTNNIAYYIDNIDKNEKGLPVIRTLVNGGKNNINITYLKENRQILTYPSNNNSLFTISPGIYNFQNSSESLKFDLGGVYTVLINSFINGNPEKISVFTITQPNSIHILWLLPQYIIITAGEIMFSITGLEFSYSQAPTSMKSVLQASFLLTNAIGNLIIVIIESAKIFEKQSSDFFLYAVLMVIDMLIFAVMAMNYKYVETTKADINELNEKNFSNNSIENPSFDNVNETK